MFDVGFSELIVIAIVALIVIGPERLPKVARTAGHLLGRLQRYVNDVKSDINREMQLDELKKLQSEVQESARSLERSVNQQIQEVEYTLHETAQSVTEVVTPPLSPEAVSPSALPASSDLLAPKSVAIEPAVDVALVAPSLDTLPQLNATEAVTR
jgi:sec-independent protein translocase protein TatB